MGGHGSGIKGHKTVRVKLKRARLIPKKLNGTRLLLGEKRYNALMRKLKKQKKDYY